MTQDDIHDAVEAIMAMRPAPSQRIQDGKFGKLYTHHKMAERQYQEELARIDNDLFLMKEEDATDSHSTP